MNSTVAGLADVRVREFLIRHPEADATRLPDGSWAVRVRDVALDTAIWSKATTTVAFFVPAAFPMARPDCFLADADLHHANGTVTSNAQVNEQPHFGSMLWFSYHPTTWDIRDTVETYFRLIRQRLADPR